MIETIIISLLFVWLIFGLWVARYQEDYIKVWRWLLYGPGLWLLLIIIGCDEVYRYVKKRLFNR